MKKIGIFLCSTLLICVMMGTMAFASSRRDTYYLSKNQSWTGTGTVTRSLNYSYGLARNYAVYPASGTDNFEYIQTQIYSGTTAISNVVTLSETAASNSRINIKEGYLSKSSIVFKIRGNNPNYNAYTDFYCSGQ